MLIAGYAVVVATAPTVHGIETEEGVNIGEEDISKLQQHLPFTVLKHKNHTKHHQHITIKLQQHLPFTVLKLIQL